MVVVDQGDDAHRVALVVSDDVLDQGSAHQTADRLAPVRVAVGLAVAIELLEQLAADRDAEPDEGVFGGFHQTSGQRVLGGSVNEAKPPEPAAIRWVCASLINLLSNANTRPFVLHPHLDPLTVLVRAGHGRLDERHAGNALDDSGVLERGGDLLATTAADCPFEGPVQVAEGFVEPFGMARGKPQVRLDRAGEIAIFRSLAIELERLPPGVVLEDGVVGDRPFERAGRPA